MKTINNILAIASIALSLTACSSDNESTSNNEGKEYPISLSVGIGDLSVVTRATSTFAPDGGKLGFYIVSNGGKSDHSSTKYFCKNEEVSCSGSTWSFPTNVVHYWASDDATIDYIAYFPHQEDSKITETSGMTKNYYQISWDVAPDVDTSNGGTVIQNLTYDPLDLLWVTSSATNSTNNHEIALTLGHACSKLTVNVKKLGSEITNSNSNATVDGISINGMSTTGTFILSSATSSEEGTWTNLNNTESIKMEKLSTPAEGMEFTYEAILIPQTAASTLMITLSNNATYQLSIPNQEYKMGTHYTITIQVGQDQVTLGGITQTNWETVTGGNLTAQ